MPPQSGIPTKQHSNKRCAVKEDGADTCNGDALVRAAFARFVNKISDLATRVNPYVDNVPQYPANPLGIGSSINEHVAGFNIAFVLIRVKELHAPVFPVRVL